MNTRTKLTRRALAASFLLATGLLRAGYSWADAPAAVAAPAVHAVTNIHDVMNGKSPRLPAFPKLAPKPGHLRGYVKDPAGKPVVGARVMARSSAFGGFGSSATGKTDANGYYEVPVPWGVARVWCAGHAVNYHGARLALPLHAADGEIDDFSTKKGHVENFVLWTYGVASESGVSENPVYSGNYYGASFTIGYFLREKGDTARPDDLVKDGEIELKLTPEGPLADGTRGQTLVLRKKLTEWSYFQVNNVPVGRYRVEARLIDDGEGRGGPLRLKDNSGRPGKGGLEPKEAVGEATVLFRSESGDPGILRVPGGNMERLSLTIERGPQP